MCGFNANRIDQHELFLFFFFSWVPFEVIVDLIKNICLQTYVEELLCISEVIFGITH